MTYIRKITILCLIFPLMGCSLQKEDMPKIKQGLYGSITWLQGNLMPSPDEPKSSLGKKIERKIVIYEALTFNSVEGQAPLFTSIKGRAIKMIKSNSRGFFECELPTGNYSVFTVEPGGKFFANSFDDKGRINSIKVEQGKVVRLDVQINYMATY